MSSQSIQRDELSKRVLNSLQQGRYVAAICSPKSGLSQLLDQLQYLIPFELNDWQCIRVNIMSLESTVTENFCDLFGQAYCASTGLESSELNGLSLEQCIKHLFSISSPCTVVMIDDFQRLSIENKKRFLDETQAIYSELGKPGFRTVLIIIGGAIDLFECQPNVSSPWNIADRIYPCEFDLTRDELRKYISTILLPNELHFDSIAQKYLGEVTQGHPYLLQCVCEELVNQKRGVAEREILIDDIETSVSLVLSEPNDHLDWLKEAILSLGTDFKLFLGEILNGVNYKFSRTETYTRSLELLGVVADRDNYVRIRSPLLERYLRMNFHNKLPQPVAPTNLMMPDLVGANIQAYEVMYALENGLRNFILSTLYGAYKRNWSHHLPKGRQWAGAATRQRKESVDPYRGQFPRPILAYCEFTDLKQVIEDNWTLFERYFGPKEKFASTYERLEEFRNTVAHNRLLSHRNFRELQNIHIAMLRCMATH